MSRPVILLVDDDRGLLELVSIRMAAAGYEVRTAVSAEQALSSFAAARPRVVVTDIRMGKMDGLDLFETIRRQAPTLPVIVLTAHGTIPDAVAATKRGVFAFLPKPFDGDLLIEQIEHALRLSGNPREAAQSDWRRGFITRSPRMEDLLCRVEMVAQSDASVFIRGASGTGKELLARAIHSTGARSQGPFVAVNCAAIPENLLESELFGYRKGSFTGATYDYKGIIPAADGGTLLLDEIGDMPMVLQAKLLRVLQEREVRPIGMSRSVPVNVRIISATHRDLETEVKAGKFREDLYYRLNVVSLEVPPLAERREDIVPLAHHFLAEAATRIGKNVRAFAPEALDLMLVAPWPGNVRQLMNVVEHAVVLTPEGVVPATLLQEALREEPAPLAPMEQARRAFERDYLVRILRAAGGNVARAAQIARRNRTQLYKLIERHGLNPRVFKASEG